MHCQPPRLACKQLAGLHMLSISAISLNYSYLYPAHQGLVGFLVFQIHVEITWKVFTSLFPFPPVKLQKKRVLMKALRRSIWILTEILRQEKSPKKKKDRVIPTNAIVPEDIT